MDKSMFKKGYKAMDEEENRRKKAAEMKRGKLWRFFLKDGEEDVPLLFLTNEPICFWEHTVQDGGRYLNEPCIGDGCKHCASSKKPSYVGAWLVVDRREYTYKDKDQKEQTGRDRIKLLVRGMTTGAQLQRLDKKYGLLDYDWFVTRTGTGTSTTWNFDRGDKMELTDKQLDALRQQLPEQYRSMDFYDIIISQIEMPEEDSSTPEPEVSEKELEAVKGNVQQLDDEEDAPKKTTRKLGKRN
jgi:hypothetical protein